jgi:hypothetical protein
MRLRKERFITFKDVPPIFHPRELERNLRCPNACFCDQDPKSKRPQSAFSSGKMLIRLEAGYGEFQRGVPGTYLRGAGLFVEESDARSRGKAGKTEFGR